MCVDAACRNCFRRFFFDKELRYRLPIAIVVFYQKMFSLLLQLNENCDHLSIRIVQNFHDMIFVFL
ncbi:Uncharacterized protein APZ42_025659 [Daphnia magna]|uniref:Uncharacterized protein n=1 Tax=Daphnia magna TaxID=35525 RepID=A0A162EEX0_9CRUS|nr:Uncharacterized protein APZ42_025659 [Daphnia magna]